ncbi:wings apart-like protein homolog [Aplysia californica]|uniref:Wings apart-like protein homolog n=1 Tax=Aplysia californica TaxID=6500 RepID=A0ABM0JAK9_APLCA|nr:wings apart-like protein homolog [Aplysia californica]XP_012935148.1 wings apart-like protein homolog [Aplysia californica]
MSEEEPPHPRFKGRTYSRTRQSVASRAFDEAMDSKTVPVKAAMSVTKWGNANYIPLRGSADGASEVKKMKLESKGEDPFSFETEDKRKSPTKKDSAPPPDIRQTTRLPASRIVVKGEGNANFEKNAEERETTKAPAFRTYSRTTPKKPVIMDQFVEVGKTTVTASGEQVFLPSTLSPKKEMKNKEEDDDDDIFPVQFKRDPLKTYSGEVVTPVDKPDSPPPRKSSYKRKGGPRGRKPLTVTDPDLIEEYKRNYAAQQLKGKPDTSTGGLNNSMVVSKKEVANEDQGTTLVVVCKPKAQLEKGEVQTKYFTKNAKSTKGIVVPVAPDSASSQETVVSGENGNGEASESSTPNSDAVPTRSSARLKATPSVAAHVEGSPSTPGSTSSLTSSSSPVSPVKRGTRGRTSDADWGSAQSGTTTSAASSDNNSQGDGSSGKTGKRYRIFKSRAPAPAPVVEDELKPPVFKDELEESPLPSSDQAVESESSEQVASENNEKIEEEPFEEESMDTGEAEEKSPSFTPEDSSQCADSGEIGAGDVEDDSSNVKPINPAAARESLAARLRNMEKGNESDSTEPDNVSECSENFQSQESPSNSQSTAEENSQKEASNVGAVRRFFKSKKSSSSGSDLQRKIFSGSPQKSPAKATYNARSWNNDSERDGEKEGPVPKGSKRNNKTDDDDIVLVKNLNKSQLKREVHWPETKFDEAYTSLRVSKTHKELYTVVHNVKQTHEVQELGETQDFMDDVDYLLDSLQDTKSTSIRCLSCLKLAGKCIMPAFRMHIRAHGTVTKIFSLLHDACTDPSLALSTSAMMFMLSRDRLNMDLDQESLNLMLRLNEVDAADKSSVDASSLRELEKTKQRVQELLAQLQQETNAREIDLGFVSTGNLAMESLLSLTSRRAGEWFKEELRSVGGLDHIVDSVAACEKSLPENMSKDIYKVLPILRKLDRCLRVLENISLQNEDNQNYLISYKQASLLSSCSRTLRLCQRHMGEYKVLENPEEDKAVKDLPGYTILTCMLAVLRVLLNITHERKLGNFKESEETSLMEAIVRCLTGTQWCIPVEQRFDLSILCLGLLINLVENQVANRKKMMEMTTQVKYTEKAQAKTMHVFNAVVQLFVQREEAAREMEEDTEGAPDTSTAESPNKSGEWKESDSGIQWITSNLKKAKEEQEKEKEKEKQSESKIVEEEGNQSILEDDEETFTKALHKAGKHMENSIVASYAGLLLGTTIMDNKEYADKLKELIPNSDLGPMIKILKKFLNFMSLTTAFGSTDVNGITRVIDVLESA